MRQNRVIFLIGLALAVLMLLACDAGGLVAFVNPTATPTRTPRPTFTPRPSVTPTPEDTPTPEATGTPALSPTPTKRAATARPATKAPTAPPVPQFSVTIDDSYSCQQSGPVWQVIAQVRRTTSPRIFVAGYTVALLSPDGKILGTDVSLSDDEKVNGLWINCRADKVFPYNAKIDAPELRGQGPFIVRVIKSKSDPTPLSPDVKVDFSQQTIWFVHFLAQQ